MGKIIAKPLDVKKELELELFKETNYAEEPILDFGRKLPSFYGYPATIREFKRYEEEEEEEEEYYDYK